MQGVGLLKQPDEAGAPAGESADDLGAPKLTENLPKIYGLLSSTAGYARNRECREVVPC